ncbi:MAG: dienelactone hydrolase family protein [Candidatus Rokubacteria bacterium]|nr:dienelactone hydrolase family protein [Candidatus Rokubacteria bacterium]MBI2015887.1 dienelactone hydrolase family protein [Candidatus Rokubacteria bacterium]
MSPPAERLVHVRVDSLTLEGALAVPPAAGGIVLFAHGSGSSRKSPRNNFVARELRAGGLGTLLMDLLTPEEDALRATRFDIDLLTRRLTAATRWLADQPETKALPLGYFGASTGAAAALKAAAALGPDVRAVVSRGGRPDLAAPDLPRVQAPTLLIVGGLDDVVLDLNRRAYETLTARKELVVVPRATHLFEEPGALEEVARLARDWFTRYLGPMNAP